MKITGLHSLWTAPHKPAPYSMTRLEAMTMMIGALEYRRSVGPIILHTDLDGLEWVEQHGIGLCYDDVIIDLHDHPRLGGLDPKIFWAAGKLVALSQHKAPCVSLDLDVILWPPGPTFTGDAQFLCHEDHSWPLSRMAVDKCVGPSKNFPVNCGVLFFGNQSLRWRYTEAVFREMAGLQHDLGPEENRHLLMGFCEQQILSNCLTEAILGNYSALDEIHYPLPFLKSSTMTHLWASKAIYRWNTELALQACRYLESHLKQNFPAAWAVRSMLPATDDTLSVVGCLPGEPDLWWTRTLATVHGDIVATSPHFPLVRRVQNGSKIFWGERLTRDLGRGTDRSSCDVTDSGRLVHHWTSEQGDAGFVQVWIDSVMGQNKAAQAVERNG